MVQHTLRVIENGVLRRIFSPNTARVTDAGENSIVRDIHYLCLSRNIIMFLKSRKIRKQAM
jgi:hypothetical protein